MIYARETRFLSDASYDGVFSITLSVRWTNLFDGLRELWKKLARVESNQLYNSSISIVIPTETAHSYKVSDSTRANFFKRSLARSSIMSSIPVIEIFWLIVPRQFKFNDENETARPDSSGAMSIS